MNNPVLAAYLKFCRRDDLTKQERSIILLIITDAVMTNSLMLFQEPLLDAYKYLGGNTLQLKYELENAKICSDAERAVQYHQKAPLG